MSPDSPHWTLDFTASRKAAQRELGRKMELLHPMVATGHHLLHDSAGVCRDHVDVAVATSFRQCLEFVDAVDILLRHLTIVPAIAQARSAVETAVSTLYLATRRDAVVASAFLHAALRHAENELVRKKNSPHLDDDDRSEIQEQLHEIDAFFGTQATDYPSRTAIVALRALPAGRPWYSIQGGPRNFRELLKRVDVPDLAQVYSDLNAAVHEGIPQMGFYGADGSAGEPEGSEWLRPLRVPSPWAFRPVLAAGLAAKISLVVTLGHFLGRLPGWMPRIEAFRAQHNPRCHESGMEVLVL